jgi:uncharacterized tellurite resistance protein B-like protein
MSMFEKIRAVLSDLMGEASPSSLEADEIRIACAALLVHCAKADGDQSPAETAKLREVLTGHYGLGDEEVDELVAEAERREAGAVDVHKFTRVLHRNLDRAGRMDVVRLLWGISHADETIDQDERNLVTLVAGLLDVEIQEAVALRRDVEGRD